MAEKGRQAVERLLHLGREGAVQDDPISDWSDEFEEVPPDVEILKEPQHGPMPYGRGKGLKRKSTPGLTDEDFVLCSRLK